MARVRIQGNGKAGKGRLPRTRKLEVATPLRGPGDPIPWDEVADRYIQSDITQDEISELYALNPRTVSQAASREHWKARRLAWRAKIQQEVSERVFSEKAAIAVEVRIRGITDRTEHMEQLTALRKVARSTQLIKVRDADGERVEEFEREWSSVDHVNYRKAYDEAESGILRALGVPDADLETVRQILFQYVPQNAQQATTPATEDDEAAPDDSSG